MIVSKPSRMNDLGWECMLLYMLMINYYTDNVMNDMHFIRYIGLILQIRNGVLLKAILREIARL